MKLKKNLDLRQIGDDYIIIDPTEESVDMTKIFSFNETMAWLWNELKNKEFSIDSAAQFLVDHYDVTFSVAQTDVEKIVKFLKEQNLLEE